MFPILYNGLWELFGPLKFSEDCPVKLRARKDFCNVLYTVQRAVGTIWTFELF